jgi:hypothetical protein
MAKYNYIFTIPGVSQPITFPAVSNEDDSKSTEGISQFFGNMKDKATLNKIKPYLKERYKEYLKAYAFLNTLKLDDKIKSLNKSAQESKIHAVDEPAFMNAFLKNGTKKPFVKLPYLTGNFKDIQNEKTAINLVDQIIEKTRQLLQKKFDSIDCSGALYESNRYDDNDTFCAYSFYIDIHVGLDISSKSK